MNFNLENIKLHLLDYIKSYGSEERHKHEVLLVTILVKHKEEIVKRITYDEDFLKNIICDTYYSNQCINWTKEVFNYFSKFFMKYGGKKLPNNFYLKSLFEFFILKNYENEKDEEEKEKYIRFFKNGLFQNDLSNCFNLNESVKKYIFLKSLNKKDDDFNFLKNSNEISLEKLKKLLNLKSLEDINDFNCYYLTIIDPKEDLDNIFKIHNYYDNSCKGFKQYIQDLRKLCENNVYPLLTSSLLDYCNEDILLYHMFFNDCYQVNYSKKLDEFAMKHHKRLENYLIGFK